VRLTGVCVADGGADGHGQRAQVEEVDKVV
jgi:hypothetical protein